MNARDSISSSSLRSWRPVLETALDAVVVMNRDGNVIDWNDNATAMFGWTAEEALGSPLADLIIPIRFREAHTRGLQRFLETGEVKILGRRIEIWGLRRSGEEIPVELSISPLSEGDGLIFLGFLRDISGRRNAERLREQHALKMEALYRAIAYATGNHSFDEALWVSLVSVQKLTGWPLAHVYLPSDTEPLQLIPSPMWYSTQPDVLEDFRAATNAAKLAPGEGLPGRVWVSREPHWIADIDADPNFPRSRGLHGIEVKSALGFPIISGDKVIAVIECFSQTVTEPDADLLLTLQAIGEQVGRVFERRRSEKVLREHAAALEVEIEQRKRVEERQKLLLAEVNHRVKNMLAVVTAIAAQTGRSSSSIDSFNQAFLSRLQALSDAHSLLTTGNWQSTSLNELAEVILSPYRTERGQLDIRGPLVSMPPKAVLSLGMVLHELVTNAAKYGALSVASGNVVLEWNVDLEGEPVVRMQWREFGTGPVSPPTRTGFGTLMVRASIQHDLKGHMTIDYGSDGIRYDFDFPLKQPK